MKNTFAVSMTLLLLLTLGGSLAGYRLATAEKEVAPRAAAEGAPAEAGAAGGTEGSTGGAAAGADIAAGSAGEAAGSEATGSAGEAAGSGSEAAGEMSSTPAAGTGGAATGGETGQQPAETAAAAPSGDAKAGATVYAGNCAGCHGANAQGGVGPNLLAADGPKAWSDAQMITALRQGKTPERELNAVMPRFSPEQVSDSDITNLHAWLKSLN